MTPIASVIIPAYNEERTIGRCLDTLLDGAETGELEVIVVCNACRDNTAAEVKRFENRGVQLITTETPSKCNALNLGDESSTTFPRIYLDADIQLGVRAVREMVAYLRENEQILLCAPRAVVDDSACDMWVRAYYRVWTRLPYFNESMVGSGVFAFSAKGRSRFGTFPDIISDDEFARRIVQPEERGNSAGSTFTISAPRNLPSLLKVNTRVRAGMYQLAGRFPETNENRGTTPLRTLREIVRQPTLWKDAPIYLGVMFAAKVLAHRKLAGQTPMAWDRDETARS